MKKTYVKPAVVSKINKSTLVTRESKNITPHIHTCQNS